MGDKTAIEWADASWNVVTGCTKVSPGCAHCYAERVSLRFGTSPAYLPGVAEIRLHPERLEVPKRWTKPRRIFVCSMSDLFHDEVPTEYIQQVLDVAASTRQHTYQILTKRAERLAELGGKLAFPPNVWLGVSVENQVFADRRIPLLLETPVTVRFLSCEPLLKPVNINRYIHDIQWVIVGGESGPRARPMKAEWVRELRDHCESAGVPFFFKQWGGLRPKDKGRILDGITHDAYPDDSASPLRLI